MEFVYIQHLQQRFDNSVIHMLIGVLVSMLNLFLYCYFGKLTTDSHLQMTLHLYESDWTGISIELKKYFILIIANMQKPLHFYGSGFFVLNLETFNVVRNI